MRVASGVRVSLARLTLAPHSLVLLLVRIAYALHKRGGRERATRCQLFASCKHTTIYTSSAGTQFTCLVPGGGVLL